MWEGRGGVDGLNSKFVETPTFPWKINSVTG